MKPITFGIPIALVTGATIATIVLSPYGKANPVPGNAGNGATITPMEMPSSTLEEATLAQKSRYASTPEHTAALRKVLAFEKTLRPLRVGPTAAETAGPLTPETQAKIRDFFGQQSTPEEKIAAIGMFHSRYVYSEARLMAKDLLPELILDKSPGVRIEAMRAIKYNGLTSHFLPQLAGYMAQPNPVFQLTAIEAGAGDDRLTPFVIPLLKSPDKEVRAAAVMHFSGRMPNKDLVTHHAHIEAALKDPDEQVRRYAMYVFAWSGNTKDIALAATQLDSPSEQMREQTAQVLGGVPKSEQAWVSSVLGKHLDDPSPVVRANVVQALGNLNAKSYAAKITKFLQDDNVYMRRASATALNQLADPAVLPALQLAQNDADSEVRRSVKWAIASLTKKQQNTSDKS